MIEDRADMQHFLSEVDLFETIPSEARAALARRADRRWFRADTRLMRQGEVARCLHVIVSGRVRLERWHPSLLAPMELDELGPGEVVGEQGLLDGQPHVDTVTAIDDTETIELDVAAVIGVVLLFPDASAALLSAVSRRRWSPSELVERLAGIAAG
jgi:CRP-like cAMP-binding protein